MRKPADKTGHGTTASPACRQQIRESSSRAEEPNSGSMTSSSSPYPSLSPSPESSSGHESPAAAPEPESSASSAATISREANAQGQDSASSPATNPAPPSVPAPQPSDPGHRSDPAVFGSATDGLADRLFHSKPKAPVAAIFIHAGAGFHSTVNEHVHLEACGEAAHLAMKFLKAGGTAVDAVEAAIKCLEDKEITNAGFGSNLSIDGIVEGDATIVDHLGRSGACGAVPMVKNPISLARLIYERSNVPLSLRRIPPNVLVGHGAARFAQEYGMRLVPHQNLITKASQERFYRWRQDLINAETLAGRRNLGTAPAVATTAVVPAAAAGSQERPGAPPATTVAGNGEERRQDASNSRQGQQRPATSGQRPVQDHVVLPPNPIGQGGPVSGITASPTSYVDARPLQGPHPPIVPSASVRHVSLSDVHAQAVMANATASSAPPSSADTRFWPPRTAVPQPKRLRLGDYNLFSNDEATARRRKSESSGDGSHVDYPLDDLPPISEAITGSLDPSYEGTAETRFAHRDIFTGAGLHDNDTDVITDTIGAIAIDLRGNIAAGSSSGGIGMKHSGRIGPAALVGIGTAVAPADPKDGSGKCAAAVTSGTGEHMATSMASHTCAERLYYNQRRAEGGCLVEEYDEDNIMKCFVTDDFMNHPGVRNQISRGAIGVMAAKRTNKGIYFYFAHNTDSFALASMSSDESEPLVVISRLGPKESVARGGRKIKGR